MKDLAFRALPAIAVAEGATTPNPGFQCLAWSSTLGSMVRFNGTTWNALVGGAASTEFDVITDSTTGTRDVALTDFVTASKNVFLVMSAAGTVRVRTNSAVAAPEGSTLNLHSAVGATLTVEAGVTIAGLSTPYVMGQGQTLQLIRDQVAPNTWYAVRGVAVTQAFILKRGMGC